MSWGRVMAVAKRHLFVSIHSPPILFDLLVWPILDLMIWGLLTLFIQKEQATLALPVGFLLGGVLLWDLLFRTNLGISIAFLDDASWSKNLINLLVSPLRPVEYLAGAMLWSLVKLAFGWAVMVLGAWALFSFSVSNVGLVLPFLMLALMLFGVVMSLVVLGLVLRYGSGADVLAWGLAGILSPLAAVYYPLSVLPEWLQKMALALPPAHVFEAMRAALAGHPIPWASVAAAFGLDILYLAAALAFAARMFALLRRRGYVTRYM